MREISRAESEVCVHLRPMLASLSSGAVIGDSEDFRKTLSALEFFLPEVLREVHPEWRDESLDGIEPAIARKPGDNEIEIVGLCILISDQSLVALHLLLQLDSTHDAISWLECWLGESTPRGMRRLPYSQTTGFGNQLLNRLDSVKWAYHVTYGEKSG